MLLQALLQRREFVEIGASANMSAKEIKIGNAYVPTPLKKR